MADAQTIKVRGEGGHVFDMDVPAVGTVRREVFDRQLAKGEILVLEGGPIADEAPESDDDQEQPNLSAKVAEWRDYGVAQGLDPDEVAKTSKKDLIALLTGDDEDTEDEEGDDESADETPESDDE